MFHYAKSYEKTLIVVSSLNLCELLQVFLMSLKGMFVIVETVFLLTPKMLS